MKFIMESSFWLQNAVRAGLKDLRIFLKLFDIKIAGKVASTNSKVVINYPE